MQQSSEREQVSVFFFTCCHASFPQGYQLYIDGELHDDVTFTKFKLDRVILSSLFDPAADCMFTKLKPRL